MRWGIDTWLITDQFFQEWRFWIVPLEDRFSIDHISRSDLPEDPLFRILYYAFDHSGARYDEPARDLLEIYDALNGTDLALRLPRPTRDPRRWLRAFESQLARVLYGAIEVGKLRFERHQMPWPFPEQDEKPESKREPQANEDSSLPDVDIFLDVPRGNADLADAYLLESVDGAFSKTLGRGAAVRKDDNTLVVRFKDVEPGKTYHLFQMSGPTRVPIFRNVPFGALGNHGTDATAPKPRPQPEARKIEPVRQAEDELVAWNDTDRNEDPSFIETEPGTALA